MWELRYFTLAAKDLAMKRNPHAEKQIISILKANEHGISFAELNWLSRLSVLTVIYVTPW